MLPTRIVHDTNVDLMAIETFRNPLSPHGISRLVFTCNSRFVIAAVIDNDMPLKYNGMSFDLSLADINENGYFNSCNVLYYYVLVIPATNRRILALFVFLYIKLSEMIFYSIVLGLVRLDIY